MLLPLPLELLVEFSLRRFEIIKVPAKLVASILVSLDKMFATQINKVSLADLYITGVNDEDVYQCVFRVELLSWTICWLDFIFVCRSKFCSKHTLVFSDINDHLRTA